jgi:hypothetical protein
VADSTLSTKPIADDAEAIAWALNREVVPVLRRLRERQTLGTTVGDGVATVFTVTHPFATLDVFVTVVDRATGEDMLPPDAVVARNGTGEVTVTFLVAPSAADGARVLVRP